jgi:hypothetical protein
VLEETGAEVFFDFLLANKKRLINAAHKEARQCRAFEVLV